VSVAELVFSGQLLVAVPLAVLAGLVSFASPCVLPLVPGYLAYVSGLSDGETTRRRLLLGVGLFVAGFTAVFVAYGALFGALGGWLVRHQDLLIRVLGLLVIVMGLVFMGRLGMLQRAIKPSWRPATGLAGAPLLGIVFGLGWTPCFGPTLVAISALSIESAAASRGALLGLASCVGLGLPFLAIAWGFGWATRAMGFLRRNLRTINIVGGGVLVLIGIAMATGLWGALIRPLQGVISGYVTPI